MATPKWVEGCGVSTAGKETFSDDNRGQSQQEELGGDGGEKGEAGGFFTFTEKVKVSLVLSLLLFLYICVSALLLCCFIPLLLYCLSSLI